MGWRRVAEQELALIKPETRAALEAYADGVNAYLDQHRPAEIAVEYTVLNAGGLDYRPEHWTAVDSLSWLKAMAWDLRGNMDDEIDRVLALADHSAEQVQELYPAYPYDEHAPIVDQGAVVDGVFEPGRDRGRHPQARSGRRTPPARGGRWPAPGRARPDAVAPRAGATASAATAGWWTATTPRPVRRSSPTTRTSAPACRASGCRWACTAGPSPRTARSTSPASPSPACPA